MAHILLEELGVCEVGAIIEKVRKNRKIPPGLKKGLEAMARVAIEGIKATERRALWQSKGKYKEFYPEMAKRISRTFHAEDEELAECFDVSTSTIYMWRHKYSDFSKAIRVGRFLFSRLGGWNTRYRVWLHPYLAQAICSVFNATDSQLADCLGVCPNTLARWKQYHSKFLDAVQYGRRIGSGEVAKVMEELDRSFGGAKAADGAVHGEGTEEQE